jgi:hypothetical protein
MSQAPSNPASASAASAPFRGAAAKLLKQPRFIVAAMVLLIAALSLNGATQFLKLHFRKLPVPLRVPSLRDPALGIAPVLDGDAVNAGKWVQVSRDEVLTHEVEVVLATKEHISREYVDTRMLPKLNGIAAFTGRSPSERLAIVNDMRNRPEKERQQFIGEVMQVAPAAIVRLHVAYYTGLADTVAHIPERCYVADGYEPTSTPDRVYGPFGKSAPNAAFRFIHFDDQTGQARLSRNVGYLFHCNGEYTDDPYIVRARLQNLLQTYGYYAKVELGVVGDPKDARVAEMAQHAMRDFMAAALPEVERVLPDWNQVTAAKK